MMVEKEQRPKDGSSFRHWPLDGRAWMELLVVYAALSVAGIGLGLALVGWIVGETGTGFDADFVRWVREYRSPELDAVSNVASSLADTWFVVTAVACAMAAFAWLWRQWHEILTLGLALGMEAVVFLTVSLTVGRDRPPVTQLDMSPPTGSFPSGHVGASVALSLILVFVVFARTRRALWRTVAAAMAMTIPVAVAFARVYLGMHFLTDVVAGALLGATCAVAVVLVIDRARDRRREGV